MPGTLRHSTYKDTVLPLYFTEGLFSFIVVREMRDRPRLDVSAVISLTCTYERGEVQAVV